MVPLVPLDEFWGRGEDWGLEELSLSTDRAMIGVSISEIPQTVLGLIGAPDKRFNADTKRQTVAIGK